MRQKIASIFVCVRPRDRGLLESAGRRAPRDLSISPEAPSPIPGHILARVIGIQWDARAIPVRYSMNTTQDPIPNPLGAAFLSVAQATTAMQASLDGWNKIPTSYIQMDITGNDGEPRASRVRLRQRDDVPDRRRLRRDCLLAVGDLHRGRRRSSTATDRQRRGFRRVERHHGRDRRRRRWRHRVPGGFLQGRHDPRQRRAVQHEGIERVPLSRSTRRRPTPSRARSIWSRSRFTSSAIRSGCRTRLNNQNSSDRRQRRDDVSVHRHRRSRRRSSRSGRSTRMTSRGARTSTRRERRSSGPAALQPGDVAFRHGFGVITGERASRRPGPASPAPACSRART